MWAAIGIGLTVALFLRTEIDITVAPIRNPQFVTLSDGAIRNTYDIRIRNMGAETATFHISLTSEQVLQVGLEGTPHLTVEVPADTTQLQRVYVTARPGTTPADTERTALRFWVEDLEDNLRAHQDTTFFGRGT
mgnify:FL=1